MCTDRNVSYAGRNPGGRRGFDPNHPDLEHYRDSF